MSQPTPPSPYSGQPQRPGQVPPHSSDQGGGRVPPYGPPPGQMPGFAGPVPGQPAAPPSPGAVPPPAPPKKSAARVVVPVVVGLLALFIGIGIGNSGDSAAADPAPTVTVTTTTQGKPGDTTTATATATVTVTEKPKAPPTTKKAEPTISDGQYEVGTDIEPGRYKTVTPAEENSNFLCYADVQYHGDYLAQEVTDKGNTIITIPNKKGAIFTSQGCGEWKKIS